VLKIIYYTKIAALLASHAVVRHFSFYGVFWLICIYLGNFIGDSLN
jgi:hypothetical protein